MNFLKNLSISKKITLSFLLVISLLMLLSVYTYNNSIDINNKLDSLTEQAVPSLNAIDSIYERLSDSRRSQLYIISQKDKMTDFSKSLDLIFSYYSTIDNFLIKYVDYIDGEQELKLYNQFKEKWEIYKQEGRSFANLIHQKRFDEAASAFEASYSKYKPLDELTTELYQVNLEYAHSESDAVRQAMANNLNGTIFCIVLLSVLLMIINTILSRQITRPLSQILAFIGAIAKGDLGYQINRDAIADDEFGQLADSSMVMQQQLSTLITNISSAVSRLQSSIEEVSAVAEQSASGMQKQQNEVILVASAIEQMRSAVAEVACNTEESSVVAKHANQASREGALDIEHTLDEIEQASAKIDDAGILVNQLQQETTNINVVVDVIRGIAEQTNLLALNAAIEAARAGEQGRGFAVVADEVRTLAGRTQDSTGEIVEIIKRLQESVHSVLMATDESCQMIKSCVSQSESFRQKMQTIESRVNNISQMSAQIATACSEQDVVTQELGKNIEIINNSSFEVAQGAGHTANSCQELAELASLLQTQVDQFKLASVN